MKSRRSLSPKRRAISQLQQGIMRLARCCSLRGGCDVTNQALPGRPPAHDLSAFDLSKRSPEQVARSFARWKAQRKRQAEAGSARAEPRPNPQPAVAETGDAAPEGTKRASAKQGIAPHYSAPFSDLLAAGSEPTVQRALWPPIAAVRPPHRTASPGGRLMVMSILAGAASVLALAGGALLELSDWRDPAEVAHVRPTETPMALAAVAMSVPAVEWTLQHTVDVALMEATPDAVRPTPEPPTPAIQTASKTVPVAGDEPVILPERKSVAPEAAQFVAKPFVPNVAPMPARSPAAQAAAPVPAPPVAAAAHAGDPRPDDLFQHGRDRRNGTVDTRSLSSGKPAAATETGSAVDARSASARKGTAASGGSIDPRGEGSGGARVRIDSEAGTPSDVGGGGISGGTSDAGASDVSGDGDANGGGSGAGPADGSDAAGDGAGDDAGAGAEGGGTGDTGAGGGDTGGDESGDAGESSSGDGKSDAGEDGESGGVGGALGAVGDALDGALGGGKGNPDSNDKDQRN
jgi:hypothetical protein